MLFSFLKWNHNHEICSNIDELGGYNVEICQSQKEKYYMNLLIWDIFNSQTHKIWEYSRKFWALEVRRNGAVFNEHKISVMLSD